MTWFFSFLHQNECECICSPLQRNPNFWFSPQKLQSKFGAMFYQLFWLICWSRLFVVCGWSDLTDRQRIPQRSSHFDFKCCKLSDWCAEEHDAQNVLSENKTFLSLAEHFVFTANPIFFCVFFFFEKCSFQSLLNSCSVGKYENESRVVILQSQRPLSKPDNIPSSTWLELLYFFSLGVITLLGATIDQIVPFLSHMPFTAPRATASWH